MAGLLDQLPGGGGGSGRRTGPPEGAGSGAGFDELVGEEVVRADAEACVGVLACADANWADSVAVDPCWAGVAFNRLSVAFAWRATCT
jgi:hypothetical protein